MYATIQDFLTDWQTETEQTARLLDVLTDASLAQRVTPQDRSLGWSAWHLVQTIVEMPARTGLKLQTLTSHEAPRPTQAVEIARTYKAAAAELAEQIKTHWDDETLKVEDDMYGMQWSRATTLTVLLRHEIHHRGQMTVLMRQAGLTIPGIYGPTREEWAAMGMTEPDLS